MSALATPKQISYALALAARAGLCPDEDALAAMERAAISRFINSMRAVPAPAQVIAATEGVYRHGETYARVKRAVHGSGNLYATVLNTATGSWDYAPGIVRVLTQDDRLTLDEARAYGQLYGQCVVCGRTLTDEESIARGIGPVCEGRI